MKAGDLLATGMPASGFSSRNIGTNWQFAWAING